MPKPTPPRPLDIVDRPDLIEAAATSMSIGAFARQMGAGPSSVWRWCSHGVRGVKLKTICVGGRTRISLNDAAAFLAATQTRRQRKGA
jgi:hypothetical protein